MRKRCSDCTRRCSCLSLFVSTCNGRPDIPHELFRLYVLGSYQRQKHLQRALLVHHADAALCLVVCAFD